jgi:hypothetical protein
LRALDGDAWDAESERLDRLWKVAYAACFVEFAMSRGWSREDAESWPDNIVDDALMTAHEHGDCPRMTAEYDVIECEKECA